MTSPVEPLPESVADAGHCHTCNAPHNNDPDRVIRCLGCAFRYDGRPPTNWAPIVPATNHADIPQKSRTNFGVIYG